MNGDSQSATLAPGKGRGLARMVLHITIIILVLAATWLAGGGYFSDFYLVAAQRGDKSLTQYEQLLRTAINYNATNGRAHMELSRLLFTQKQYDRALAEQVTALKSVRTLSAYEHMGSIEEKLGDTQDGEGKTVHLSAAKKQFEMAEAVYPGNVTALEHQLLIAFKTGDDSQLQELSRKVTRAQAENLNGTYITGMSAERAGNLRAAYGKYQRLAAAPQLPKGSIFTTATVTQRLEQIRRKLDSGR